jgi:hypothetical protein
MVSPEGAAAGGSVLLVSPCHDRGGWSYRILLLPIREGILKKEASNVRVPGNIGNECSGICLFL